LQVGQQMQKTMAHRVQTAAAALSDAASRSGDRRLLALAANFGGPSVKTKFDPIIKAINKMIKLLQEEEETDLDTKQTCEEDRMEDTREAIRRSREIDEDTDQITKLTAQIKGCVNKIKELKAEQKTNREALSKAQRMRNDEHTAWENTDRDDKAAAETVQSARDVLEQFYKENNLKFMQKSAQPVTGMAGGDAPPPPPATWEGDYGGKTGESQGIIAIMEMVRDDIIKDRKDAKADEDSAASEFAAFKKDSDSTFKDLRDEERATSKDMGKAETEKTQTERQRRNQKKKLNNVLDTIQQINPNCEYYEVNYPMRTKNRQIEIDGLNKAMAILEGGEFTDAPDPNREMKVGDAFLQRLK